jgi:hypothetical protein
MEEEGGREAVPRAANDDCETEPNSLKFTAPEVDSSSPPRPLPASLSLIQPVPTSTMMTKSPYHHDSLDKSITLDFDLSQRDPSFASFRQPYTISYSLQLPLKPTGDTPVLVLCHPFNNSRLYWSPQLHDPLFASYPIITIDAVGFSHSRTGGRAWSFDLAAESVLAILDELAQAHIEGYRSDIKAVVIGDSMGGGPTGLRVLLRDQERVQSGMEARVLGTVACGTAAEVESSGMSIRCCGGATRLS